jgi:DEAD/DEAH box helicase domain-containing protein
VGDVEVTERVTGYRRRDLRTGEVLGDEELDLPPSTLRTRAFWYTVEERVLHDAGLVAAQVPGTLHAAEHAGIGMLPLFTICDRWDVGGVSTAFQADTGRPTIVIYDGYPGGAGIAELGFAAGRRHLEATVEAIAACPCATGCPSCVQSPKCGNLNEPLDKAGAVAFLRTVLG